MSRPSALPVGVLMLCALPFGALSTRAQGKPGRTTPVAKISAQPPKAAALFLPILVGAGGLLIGGALGFALKKPKPIAVALAVKPIGLPFDDAPFPLALIDGSEKIIRANAPFSLFLGLPDATGTPLPRWIHPDDLTRVRDALGEVLEGKSAPLDLRRRTLASRFFDLDGHLRHTVLSGQKAGDAGGGATLLVALQDVSPQIEAQAELRGAREAISALYQVIAGDKSLDLDGKIKSLLAMGCGRFESSIGVLGRFANGEAAREGSESVFETLFVQSPDRRVRPALQLRRGDTSLEAQLLGLKMLPTRATYRNHPWVQSSDGISYFGAPVVVAGGLFGMLSFSDLTPRATPFSGEEALLLQLMAEWVGGEIERDRARQALEQQKKALLEANHQLELLATHDPLTGAKNRRAFNEKLEEEWSRAKRYNTPLSLVLMDVDKFKSYNDAFGHPAGDEVLKRVARTLMGAIRTTDFFARYGGEEFVLILPNTDAEGALILANRLREKIETTPWKERAVTVSMGVSTLDLAFKTAAELTQSADNALYASKENGRNRVTHVRDLATLEERMQ